MTKKELSNLYYLKKEIKEQEKRIEELENEATKCTSKITGLPRGTGVSDKVGDYAAQIADLKTLLDINLKKRIYELNKLETYIQSVEDALVRQIMVYRFINNYSWAKIARCIGGNNTAESLRKQLCRYLENKGGD